MTTVQQCPDSLLARARTGALSSPERSQLKGHLRQCEACRVSLLIGQDFDRALAARSDDTLLVSRTIASVRAATDRRASVWRRARRAPPGVRLFAYGVVAASLTISCVVGATIPALRRTVAVFFGLHERGGERTERAVVAISSMPRSIAGTPPPKSMSRTETSAPPSSNPNASPAPAERGAVPHDGTRVSASADRRALQTSPAKDLFAEANAKRRAGDEQGASRLYRELQQRFPQSPEAEVSRVALGRLLLERAQDPKAALDQFDRAASPLGSDEAGLAEEVLFGRATALMRLGRTAEEHKTWLQLLRRFPGSVYAQRAKVRLDELNLATDGNTRASKPSLN